MSSSEVPRTSCLICNEKFPNSKKVDLHIKVVHLRMFICAKCPNFSTMIKMRMTQHNRKSHGGDKPASKRSAVQKSTSVNADDGDSPTKKMRTISEDLEGDSEDTTVRTRYECEECWFAAETQEKLNHHIKEKHNSNTVARGQNNQADKSLDQEKLGATSLEVSVATSNNQPIHVEENQAANSPETKSASGVQKSGKVLTASKNPDPGVESSEVHGEAEVVELQDKTVHERPSNKESVEGESTLDKALTCSATTGEQEKFDTAPVEYASTPADLPKVDLSKLKLFESLDQAIKGIELQIKSVVKPLEIADQEMSAPDFVA